jgi:non-homologous end joining protein Ku
MARELIGALEGAFEPEAYHDEYRERVLAFVEARAKGKKPRLPEFPKRSAGQSLDDQLARSLAALKRGKERKVA